MLVSDSISRIPGPAARTLSAHDDDFAGADIVYAHGRDRRLFVLEDASRTAEGVVVVLDGADFDHRAVGSEIAEQHAECSARRVRLVDRADALLVEIAHAFEILARPSFR